MSEFANPFPHTALNHFLRTSNMQLEGQDVVYIITSNSPTLDQVVAAICYAFLRTSSSHTTYIPVIQASRVSTLEKNLLELALALQASLISPENLTFIDDQEWRTATAFASHSQAILIGASSQFKTKEALKQWKQVQGINIVGLIDSQVDLSIFDQGLETTLTQQGSLTSLVTLHFKHHFSTELADLALSAILIQTDNLAESKTSPSDLGAVGYLVPKSSFQNSQEIPFASSPTTEEDDVNYDAYVPTFPDLDAFYKVLKAAAKGRMVASAGKGDGEPILPPLHFEWNLITGSLLAFDKDSQAPDIPGFAHKTIVGEFTDILTSPLAIKLLAPYGAALGAAALTDALNLSSIDLSSLLTSPYESLCIAIASLHAFIQLNWTGPDLNLTPYALVRSSSPSSFPPRSVQGHSEEDIEKLLHRASLDALVFKGEPAYHLCQAPFFLVFAQKLFESLEGETLPWWRLRASTVHSHVLDEPVSFGKSIFDPVQALIRSMEVKAKGYGYTESRNPWASLAARLVLERGVALERLGNDKQASEQFVEAAKLNGLQYQLGGALGKRTKYQKEDKTQLVLLAKSAVVDEEESIETEKKAEEEEKIDDGWQANINPEEQVAGMPSTYALNDDLLLEQTRFTTTTPSEQRDDLTSLDPNDQPPLAILDQTILLALCLNIRNTQPSHGLTSNQMASFVSRVISHPRNWMVHTMSLLLRARLESTRTRTVERSVLQLQALIDQMATSDSTLQERLKWFHTLDVPPKWALQSELAQRYLNMGVTRSALEIFERIQMWQEVVQCLGMLGRQTQGVEIIRDLLQGTKVEASLELSRRKRTANSTAQAVQYTRLDRARESKLWCLLGDLEPERSLEHYSKAWATWNSARAARSLGGYHFARNNYAQATRWLREGLKINPLYTRSWFVLGCCYLRLEEWKEAALCFRRCTSLDEEDGESWNNLASCYLSMSEAGDAVEVETMGREGRDPDLESLSGEPDSGIELSHIQEEAPSQATRARSTYNLKLLAHRSLGKSLRSSHENWRVWYNYMIVSVDVGLLSEATRAMVRIVEIQSRSCAESVDVKVLGKLVDASVRDTETYSKNEGEGLYHSVRALFDETLLTKVSRLEVWKLYAILTRHRGEYGKMIQAHLNAWKSISSDHVEHDIKAFRASAAQLTDLVDILLEFGPKIDSQTQQTAMADSRFQARSLVRSLLARTRQSFEDEKEFETLQERLKELR